MFIVLAIVVAFISFRPAGPLWPLYLFLVVGIVHLYATVFSRGAALAGAMWFLVVIALFCVALEVADVVPVRLPSGGPVPTVLRVLPVALWLGLTGYMFVIGSSRTLSAMRVSTTYFLAVTTFTLGFWGVWVFYLENGLATRGLYLAAIGTGLLVPLASVVFLLALGVRGGRATRDWLMNIGAMALAVFAAHLILAGSLASALAFLLGHFLPRILGAAPFAGVSTDWLGDQEWRSLVTSVLLLVALVVASVNGVLEASKAEDQRGRRAIDIKTKESRRDRLDEALDGPTVPLGGEASTEAAEPEPARADDSPQQTVLVDAGDDTSFAVRFLGEAGLAITRNVGATIGQAISVVLPAVAFTLLSLLIVLVLATMGEYLRLGPFMDAVTLWGMTVTILIAAIVLGAAAVDLAPVPRDAIWDRQRFLGVPVVVMAAVSVLGGLCYFLISLASAALLPMLQPDLTDVRVLLSRDVYVFNLAISLVALTVLVLLYTIGTRVIRRRDKVLRGPIRLSAAAVLLLLGLASVLFGVGPIQTAAAFAASPYDASARPRLAGQVPAALVSDCGPDELLLTGQLAGLRCHQASGPVDVSYHLFGSEAQLTRWYDRAVRARSLRAGSGSCAGGQPAEAPYALGRHTGRVACYVDHSGAWLIWTDTRSSVLGIARRPDGLAEALYASWLAAIGPTSADNGGPAR